MTQQELKHLLSSKFDFEKWKDLLGTMFLKIDYLTKPIQIEAALVKSGGQVGVIRLDDGRSLGLFKFEVADNIKIARNRKGLRDIAIKYVDQDITHGALVLYYSEDQADYRLTFVSKQTSLNEDGEFVTKATAPKRYTFLLGENEPCTTASIRLLELINKKKNGSVYLADVTEAFSVERLNKDFFKGYIDQYRKFLNYIGEQSKAHRDYVKKLLGRLVFLQFLQKKGWMGVPASNTNWEGGDKNYLNNLIENYKGNNRLLSDVLEVLFFNTLNEKRDNDLADKILGENIKIPYLNGGLFDKDSLDKLDIDFPYDYFKELMEFFAMYNFTIDENDPDDAEVGVDPEMLGHIFENLLEDNKDKGAFYTPKEIVQYMSQESIAQYLKTHTEETLHTAIEGLIKERKVNEALQNKASASKVYDLLRDVKVCDPAIGSGAFPMGVLNVLYHSRQVLYGFTKSMEPFSPAAVKREIIQNNIYGVDIEQGAIDIARLRFWLALVVDELKPEPLPNLDYKIMQGNSLLESFEGLDMSRIAGRTVGRPSNSPQLIIGLDSDLNRKNLQKLMRQYFSTDDHTAKAELRQIINNEVKSLIRNSLGGTTASLNHLEQLDCSANSDFFLWHTWFKDVFDNGGFDVVIGNPPYLRIQGLRESNPKFADYLSKHYESASGSFDLYVTFAERGLGLINQKGVVNYIMPTKWTNSAFGKGLRRLVSKTKSASKIINFGAYQVFNASTYTGLQWFSPNSEYLKYIELDRDLSSNDELKQYLDSLNDEHSTIIKSEKLNESQWVLTKNAVSEILNRLEQHPRRIKDVFDKIFQGLATSKDDVYFIYDCSVDGEFIVGESKQLGCKVQIEKGLVKPLLKGEDVHRYDTIKTDRYVIFPYKILNGKAVLYSESELSEQFPSGYNYLKECEEILREREHGRLRDDDYWYRYIYPKNLVLFDNEKLVAPEISMGGNFAYDKNGEFYSTTKIYGYIKKKSIKESYKFWMALFNSRLFWFFIQNTGYVLRGGYYTFKTDYINPFPVPSFEITSKVQDFVGQLVDFILYLKNDANPEVLSHTSNDRIILHIMEIVDMVIYELYFEQHMKDNQIDVISYLKSYPWSIKPIDISVNIKEFYYWYQQSDNPIRQHIMLLETRSKYLLYQIHSKSII